MPIKMGLLKKTKKGFRVALPTKKGGMAEHAIPVSACCFRPQDGADDLEVEVELDDKHHIVKVRIPGKPEVSAPANENQSQTRGSQKGGQQMRKSSHKSGRQQAVRELKKASAFVLGLPFHNPYTFLPFPTELPFRSHPTPLSADELEGEQDRLTGVLELEVTTESPLLTCHPKPVREKNGHKEYEVLKIGRDVIVPSTGIRGALRTLLTSLTGGTLGYLNQHAYLCQGRDVNLGPRGSRSPQNTPIKPFLAEVERPGTAFRSGVVRLGQTRLVRLDAIEKIYRNTIPRGPNAKSLWVGLDNNNEPTKVSRERSQQTRWKLKASGRPIMLKGKREGLFLPGEETLTLPAELWAAYSGRNAHGDRTELREGDLIWLEPKDPNAKEIRKPEDVRSIQWARWGRRGQAMKEHIEQHAPQVLPDSLRNDGLVDEVTNLFGQIPDRDTNAPAFAARVRAENLVFFDASERVDRVTLAPLAPPHPGCIAFYRAATDPDEVSESDSIAGYKVYRTTQERGEQAPWQFKVQGVYGDTGELKDPQQKVNKTCDLLQEGTRGVVRITFRSLTKRELALIIQVCDLPWRLGGGKPFGLGLCSVRIRRLMDEHGQPLQVTEWKNVPSGDFVRIEGWEQDVSDLHGRVRMWKASQEPVPKLRYPRAVDKNRNRISRGGHVWFQRHASPRMVTRDGARESGLEPLYIDGDLKKTVEQTDQPLDDQTPMISGQLLPLFDPEDPLADVLYDYDGFGSKTRDEKQPRRRVFLQIEAFDSKRHVTGKERSGGSHGKDAQFRKQQKRGRRKKN